MIKSVRARPIIPSPGTNNASRSIIHRATAACVFVGSDRAQAHCEKSSASSRARPSRMPPVLWRAPPRFMNVQWLRGDRSHSIEQPKGLASSTFSYSWRHALQMGRAARSGGQQAGLRAPSLLVRESASILIRGSSLLELYHVIETDGTPEFYRPINFAHPCMKRLCALV
jgi:hypothetical protein